MRKKWGPGKHPRPGIEDRHSDGTSRGFRSGEVLTWPPETAAKRSRTQVEGSLTRQSSAAGCRRLGGCDSRLANRLSSHGR